VSLAGMVADDSERYEDKKHALDQNQQLFENLTKSGSQWM